MTIELTRRAVLKLFGSSAIGLAVAGCGVTGAKPVREDKELSGHEKARFGKTITTICPYCGVGCGLVVLRREEGAKVLSVEGDPDHPVNEGSLCSKGSALYQLHHTYDGKINPRRLQHVMYRKPGSNKWEKKSWGWTLDRIAKLVKETRDKTFKEKEGNLVVNRCEGIGNLGGASLDSEECYILSKLARALGIVYLEHQARI